ncbi:hypothetical protein LLEC1_07063 [Akanthomyces lecanii]|uniref:SHSP domain-containing protein n=1 Tax=Cordyceps confragosa TaxID=2714763 RepID=A0A179I3J7_CORDF|nr:hypothetical protein LLEC1_07063 [Akanthomyces lecanii]
MSLFPRTFGGGGGFGSSLWQPKFDVRETGDVYELHGEFPGLRKEDICIEFPQPQTLVVRGKSERTYSSGPAPAASAAGRIEDVSSDKPAASTTTTESHGTEAVAAQASTKATEKVEQPKYWLKERRVGEFSRTFNFPSAVDADGISAGFKDGILSVSVPKAKKPQPRRIAIN